MKSEILVNKEEIMEKYDTNIKRTIKGIKKLENMGLLPLKVSNNRAFQQFIITLGLRYADGCIYKQRENKSFTTYVCFGEKKDALNFCKDVKKAWGIELKPHLYSIYYVYLPASLGRLMISAGSPFGNKVYQNFRLPKWIFNLNEDLRWKFIDGFFSGDASAPKLKRSKNSCETLKLSLNTREDIVRKFSKGFMTDIKRLISGLGVKVSGPKIVWNRPIISKKGIVTYSVIINISTRKENMIRFLENVQYKYKESARVQDVLDALKYKNRIIELKDYIRGNKKNCPNICVLLKKGLQRKLIIGAANKISNKTWGKYKKLAIHLKRNCNTFNSIKLESIFDVYIPRWKRSIKYIPIDCVVELFKLNNLNMTILENSIKKLKILRTHNEFAVQFRG